MTNKFQGGLETLQPLHEADDAYSAAGIWWARALLNPKFDLRVRHTESENQFWARHDRQERLLERALERRDGIKQNIGGFATALAEFTREQAVERLAVKGEAADDVLREAAIWSGIPVDHEDPIFPAMSYTDILREGSLLIARVGASGMERRVWPPARAV